MTSPIPEADWRQFKRVHATLLERYCTRALQEITLVLKTSGATSHDRYVRIVRLIEAFNDDLAQAFDDSRRATAITHLAVMRRMGLLTDDDMAAFTKPTQDKLRGISPAAVRDYTD